MCIICVSQCNIGMQILADEFYEVLHITYIRVETLTCYGDLSRINSCSLVHARYVGVICVSQWYIGMQISADEFYEVLHITYIEVKTLTCYGDLSRINLCSLVYARYAGLICVSL